MPTYVGTAGNDTYSGSDDVFYGLDGDDILTVTFRATSSDYGIVYGGEGNDRLLREEDELAPLGSAIGGRGNDTIGGFLYTEGGPGDDVILAHRNTYGATVYGGDGNDTIHVRGGRAHGGAGNDTIRSSISPLGESPLYGDDGDDLIISEGRGASYGGAGNDLIYQQSGYAFGGHGNDTLVGGFLGGSAIQNLYGGEGDDWIYGGSAHDVLVGGEGVDTLVGNDGNDYLYAGSRGGLAYGGAGNDVAIGSQLRDVIVLGEDNDVAYGYAANDYLYGEAGHDILFGGEGSDVLIGGSGDDWLDGGEGVNYYFGGDGGGPGTATGINTYVVRDIAAVHVVQDFNAASDLVRFEGSGFSGFDDVLAHSYQNDGYFVIQVDVDTAVWLQGTTAAALTAANFVIVS